MAEDKRLGALSHLFALIVGVSAIWRLPESSAVQPGHFGAIVLLAYALVASARGASGSLDVKVVFVCLTLLYFGARDIAEVVMADAKGAHVAAAYLCYSIIIALTSRSEWRNFLRAVFRYALVAFAVSVMVGVHSAYVRPLSIDRGVGLSGTANHLALQGLILFVVAREVIDSRGARAAAYIAAAAAQVLSLSRAAMVAGAVFLAGRARRLLIVGLVLMWAGLAVFGDRIDLRVPVEVTERLTLVGNPSDREGRGYRRVALYPEFFIFGASDLRMEFPGDPFKGLIHNNLIQPIFAFGAFGMMFVVIVHYAIARHFGIISLLTLCIVSMGHYFYQNFLFILLIAFALNGPVRTTLERSRYRGTRPQLQGAVTAVRDTRN